MPDEKKVAKEDLASVLKGILDETVPDMIQKAVKEQVKEPTDWMATILSKKESSKPVSSGGIGAARYIRAIAFGRGDVNRAKHFCEKAWDDELGDRVKKALQAGDLTAGGALLPPEFAAEVIELLRSKAIVRAAGARVLSMPSGSLTLRKQTAGATAAYVGESQNITKTQPTVGQIVMTAKKLAAIVPISNDLLHFANNPTADEFVRDDLVMHLAVREDQAFLRDTGLEDTPKGMRYWAQSDNVTATNGTSATNIEADFKDLINDLETNDVRLIRPVWFMNPRSKNHLVNLRDANGNLIYPEVRGVAPTLYGYPVYTSTSVPINLGGGTATEVYFADMVDCVIGEATDLEIAVDGSASYVDSGSLVSAFSRDETLVRAIMRHDFALRHAESVAVKTGVTWGA